MEVEVKIDDGGPAFPRTGHRIRPDGKSYYETIEAQIGMSLRDWFAGMAMQGMIASGNPTYDKGDACLGAYKWADAMLAARKEKP
jgi:hypothetical protein